MKSNIKIINTLSFFLALSFCFTSCLEDSCEETNHFIQYEAIYAQPEEFRIEPTFIEDRKMEITGKIYYYNNLLIINERYEGIHLIDNTDPTQPEGLGFLSIPGNLDVAIRGNIMYADSYVDLVTIDISDWQNTKVLCRDEEVFDVYNWIDERGYFVGTRETPVSIELDCTDPNFGSQSFWRGDDIFVNAEFDSSRPSGIANTSTQQTANVTGVGGSFARFSVIDDYLYVLNNFNLISYNLANPSKPMMTADTEVGWNIETLFPYKDYLFIGGNTGMFIYDRTDPAMPSYVSQFNHANACDPVFVHNDIAYVTLRNGTQCQNFINQLDVIDVSNIKNPQLIESYDMDHPHGLAVKNNNLYICEGEHGLKVYNNEDLENIAGNRLSHLKDFDAYDIIALAQDHIMVIGADGLYQFDSSNPKNLEQLSIIKTQ